MQWEEEKILLFAWKDYLKENKLPLTYSTIKNNYILNCPTRCIEFWCTKFVVYMILKGPLGRFLIQSPAESNIIWVQFRFPAGPCIENLQKPTNQSTNQNQTDANFDWRRPPILKMMTDFFFWTTLILTSTCRLLSFHHAPLWKVCLYILEHFHTGVGELLLCLPKADSSPGWTNLAPSASSHGVSGLVPIWLSG